MNVKTPASWLPMYFFILLILIQAGVYGLVDHNEKQIKQMYDQMQGLKYASELRQVVGQFTLDWALEVQSGSQNHVEPSRLFPLWMAADQRLGKLFVEMEPIHDEKLGPLLSHWRQLWQRMGDRILKLTGANLSSTDWQTQLITDLKDLNTQLQSYEAACFQKGQQAVNTTNGNSWHVSQIGAYIATLISGVGAVVKLIELAKTGKADS